MINKRLRTGVHRMACNDYDAGLKSSKLVFSCDRCCKHFERRKRDAINSRVIFDGKDYCKVCSIEMSRENLVGKSYGKFIVEKFSHSDGQNNFWECLCSCGGKRKVKTSALKSGSMFHCEACQKASEINLTDKNFGKIHVVDVAYTKQEKHWNCICSCGNKFILQQNRLVSGAATTCRSCSYQKKRENIYGELPAKYWWIVLRGAKERNKEVSITAKYAFETFLNQNRKCALSGVDIGFRDETNSKHTASLDRIDSTKHYEEGNIQWVHKNINKMKQDLNQNIFLEFCRLVTEFVP
jgi:hypothetical protein